MWQMEYTQGFNPRVKYSASPPLSLGFKSECEYFDVYVKRYPEGYQIDFFKRNIIKGIDIKEISAPAEGDPGINSLIKGFIYRVSFESFDYSLLENIGAVETGRGYFILEVRKENGNIKNPAKLIGQGMYEIEKLKCIWEEKENESE